MPDTHSQHACELLAAELLLTCPLKVFFIRKYLLREEEGFPSRHTYLWNFASVNACTEQQLAFTPRIELRCKQKQQRLSKALPALAACTPLPVDDPTSSLTICKFWLCRAMELPKYFTADSLKCWPESGIVPPATMGTV
eukprot:1143328-Pelagomonas_calceolata.AAC.10